jgi:hypothetical protein
MPTRTPHAWPLAAVPSLSTGSHHTLVSSVTVSRPFASPPLPQPGMPAGVQQAMSAAMNDPAVQSMFNNPDLIRTLLQANPAVREVMERNPEVGAGCQRENWSANRSSEGKVTEEKVRPDRECCDVPA